jgi:hypothetical protein
MTEDHAAVARVLTRDEYDKALSRVPVDLDAPLKDLDQAFRIATMLSQSNMVPEALRGRPQNCLVTMMLGRELGLSWVQAIRGIYVLPSGQPGLRGKLLLARLRTAGHKYRFERTPDSCRCIITRKDEEFKIEYDGEFSLEDAKMAELVTEKDGKLIARSNAGRKMPWELFHRDMLQWRAVVRAVDIAAPELVYGFDLAGIGDTYDTAVSSMQAAVIPAPAVGAGIVPDDQMRGKLAELDREAMPGQPPAAEDDTTSGTGPAPADYEVPAAAPADAPVSGAAEGGERMPGDPSAAGAASPRGAQQPPPPDQAAAVRRLLVPLRTCGYTRGDEQLRAVSALIHRDISSFTDLTPAELLIATQGADAIIDEAEPRATKAELRAAMAERIQYERDAWADTE